MALEASLTFCTAGNNNPISIAIIAITTSNSIRVNALYRKVKEALIDYLQKDNLS